MNLIGCTLLAGLLASAAPAQYTETYQAGLAKQRAGKQAEARKDFQEALHRATTNVEKAEAQLGIGMTYDAEQNHAMARTELGKVLAMEGATPDHKAQAQCLIGTGYYWEKQYPTARTELAKVLAMEEGPARWKIQAQMFIGHSWSRDYEHKSSEARKACADAIIAYAKVPDMPGVSPGQKADAQMAIVNTLLAVKSYPDARAELMNMLETNDLPPASQARARVWLGRSHFLERNYAAARAELAQALALEGLSVGDRVDAQLHSVSWQHSPAQGLATSVRSAMLQVIALAQFAMTYARGWAADSVNTRVRLKAELDQANQDAN